MSVKTGQDVRALFVTSSASTGAAASPSSSPVGILYINGASNAAAVIMTKLATGVFAASVTMPSLSAGDSTALRVSACVDGVQGEGIVWQDLADTIRISDVAASVWTNTTRALTDKSGFSVTASAASAIADTVLTRDWNLITDTPASRSAWNALRFLRNRWGIVDTTLTVYAENDTTAAWTATVTTSAGASPIVQTDPT